MNVPIFDIENWKEIGATLARNKTRTFLTGFGIFWGVAMLAILMGGARGGTDMLRRNFAGISTNSAGIIANRTTMPYKGTPKGRRWYLDLTDVERLRQNVPQLEAIVPVYQSWGDASCRNGKYSYAGTAMGSVPGYAKVSPPKMYGGRFINEADEQQARKVVVLGKKIANEIFPNDPNPVGKTLQINSITYSIIGIMGNLSEASVGGELDKATMLPASTFRKAFARADKVDFIMFLAKDRYRMTDLVPQIRTTIYKRHVISPDDKSAMWVMDISEMFEQVNGLFMGLNFLALFIGLSTLLAGVIGIGNIMWVIVKERTQEIGIRRAIGAKPRDIVVQVLCEGVALTMVAGVAGICFAAAILGALSSMTNRDDPSVFAHFQMSFVGAMAIVGVFVVLGTLAGLIPSIKAMKIKPIEALNDK